MALTSIAAAQAQYAANIPWNGSQAAAQLALEAVQYLLIFRATRMSDQGTDINYESLAAEKMALETFLGSTGPRAFGRRRRVSASFHGSGLQ